MLGHGTLSDGEHFGDLSLLLGERLGSLQMAGAALVMVGLLINVWGGRLLDSWRQRAPGAV